MIHELQRLPVLGSISMMEVLKLTRLSANENENKTENEAADQKMVKDV
jgi:hypothetical protein